MTTLYIPPAPLTGNQFVMAVIIAGVFFLWLLFGEDIARWFRANFTITRTDRHTPSVSNLSAPTHVLSSDNEPEPDDDDYEPDEDDLRIARNNRMAERLHPFDRVLVRDDEYDKWEPAFFAYYDESDDSYPFYCTNNAHFVECIPYVGNEHLYLTNEDYDYE